MAHRADPEVKQEVKNTMECAGAKIDFTIDDASPALLDLGELENPPLYKTNDRALDWLGGSPPLDFRGDVFMGKEKGVKKAIEGAKKKAS